MQSLADFPTEILLAIFSELDYFSLIDIPSVCRRFQRIVGDAKANQLADQFWKLSNNARQQYIDQQAQSASKDTTVKAQNAGEEAAQANEAHTLATPRNDIGETFYAQLHPSFTLLKVPYKRIIEPNAFLNVEEVGFVRSSSANINKFIPFTSTPVGQERAIRILHQVNDADEKSEKFLESPLIMCHATLIPYLHSLTVEDVIQANLRISYPEHTARYITPIHGGEYVNLSDSRVSIILCVSDEGMWTIWHPPVHAIVHKLSSG